MTYKKSIFLEKAKMIQFIKISKGYNIPGIIGGITGAFGLLFLFRALIASPSKEVLWISDFDTNLMVWIVEWGYHILFEKWEWLEFWNANQFFPHMGSLAFSDSFISAQIFYGPLRLIGLSPLPALYWTFVLFSLTGCLLSDWALTRIGNFKSYERAVIVYVAHFSLPMVTFLGHYQFFGFQLAPSFFLFFYLLLRDGGGVYLVLLSLLFAFATGFSTYFAPMSAGVVVGVFLFMAIRKNLILHLRRLYNSLSWTSLSVSLAIVAILFMIQLKPYLDLFSDLSAQNWKETAIYSARPWSFLLHPSLMSWLYAPSGATWGYWEKCYFPGILLILATAVSIFASLRTFQIERRRKDISRPAETITIGQYAMALFIISYVFSWGPLSRFEFLGISGKIYFPFALPAKLLPGFENIRAPGRFGMFLGLSLGFFMVTTIRILMTSRIGVRLNRFSSALLIFFLMVGLVVDSGLDTEIYPYKIDNLKFYQKTKSLIEDHEPTMVLPLAMGEHLDTIKNFMEQLKGSTIHHGWMVAGYGSRSTAELDALTQLDEQFQNGSITFESLLDKARKFKVRKVIIFKNHYSEEQMAGIELSITKNLELLYTSDEGILIKIPIKKKDVALSF